MPDIRIKSGKKEFVLYPGMLKIDMVRNWVIVGNGDLYDYGFTVKDIEEHGVQVTVDGVVILEITDNAMQHVPPQSG